MAGEPYAHRYLRGTSFRDNVRRCLPIVTTRRLKRRATTWLYTNLPDQVFRLYLGQSEASFVNRLKEAQRIAARDAKSDVANLLLRSSDVAADSSQSNNVRHTL